jgi:glycosyltransferase involved in cell wall biosynthesis
VVTWHNAILGTGRSAVAGRLLQRSVARAADLTLGASSDLVATATALGARRARLGPVAAPVLPAPTTGRTELRALLGLRPDDVAVLTVSRLAPQKNLAMVLDVAAAVRDRDDLRFLVVGAGPERAGLQQRIDAEGLAVSLLGRRDDIADLLAAADLALLVSTWEARALVAQEALLAGLPLVSTRVGGIEELVGDAAALVELGDVPGAVAAVSRLADDPRERRRLSRAGRARAADWPDEDQVARDVLAAYAEARRP